jgi:hypothetical protein
MNEEDREIVANEQDEEIRNRIVANKHNEEIRNRIVANKHNEEIRNRPLRAAWTDEQVNYLIDAIMEIVGNRTAEENGFKSQEWTIIVTRFKQLAGIRYSRRQLQSKLTDLKYKWETWNALINNSWFEWDAAAKIPTAPDDVWKVYLQRHPKVVSFNFRYETLSRGDDLFEIFAGQIPTKEFVEYRRAGAANLELPPLNHPEATVGAYQPDEVDDAFDNARVGVLPVVDNAIAVVDGGARRQELPPPPAPSRKRDHLEAITGILTSIEAAQNAFLQAPSMYARAVGKFMDESKPFAANRSPAERNKIRNALRMHAEEFLLNPNDEDCMLFLEDILNE